MGERPTTSTSPAYQDRGRPRKPRLRDGQRRTMAERSEELPGDAWREITVAEGSQGPRSYRFSAQRVRPTSKRKPGEIHWAIYRRNLDGSEPRYYLSNAPEDTPLETLAYVGGSRWRIETEFETEKSHMGLDDYETRTWPGWHHHLALCLLAGALLGGKMPRITRPQVYRVVREMLPRDRTGGATPVGWGISVRWVTPRENRPSSLRSRLLTWLNINRGWKGLPTTSVTASGITSETTTTTGRPALTGSPRQIPCVVHDKLTEQRSFSKSVAFLLAINTEPRRGLVKEPRLGGVKRYSIGQQPVPFPHVSSSNDAHE